MHWQEDEDLERQFVVPDNVVDLAFSIECKALPVDHSYALASAIEEHLPWFVTEQSCALHLIHGAESGNGWDRPENGDDLIYLSRRTKLVLRVPKERIESAQELTGKELIVDEQIINVGKANTKKLADSTALYTRYLDTSHDETEEEFIDRAVADLRAMGLEFKKILAGKAHTHKGDDDQITLTRSLFIADLGRLDSIRLQEQGMGSRQNLGFGVFIPHKTLK
ncbi:MAG: type I-MYXAN CRISPR-associated protein Cas6/Cmx6 [Gammaproteobacteria bacterium]|nr:type I-MYXAN CRISPR-associated protein Cas6/Cmx6 [Gammaproteobacteria bacterium]